MFIVFMRGFVGTILAFTFRLGRVCGVVHGQGKIVQWYKRWICQKLRAKRQQTGGIRDESKATVGRLEQMHLVRCVSVVYWHNMTSENGDMRGWLRRGEAIEGLCRFSRNARKERGDEASPPRAVGDEYKQLRASKGALRSGHKP